ncbi:transcription factor TFIIIB component B'' homolog [Electrophorus electricus]|uniref:transcription factor TFIIIB component B'' homolog n=1 Tax=Electrophorus electricus TaxID=8005 RepID=UPI0015CF9027|nr:transcription factor TFIIIB component B'' homolog [Electrophorus electricus]
MIRRSRISVRPNVRPASRPPTASRDASQDDLQRPASPSAVGHDTGAKPANEGVTPALAGEPGVNAETQKDGMVTQESCNPVAHVGGQNSAPSPLATVGTQRRKRISVLPNVAKPRTAAASTPASAPGPAHAPAPAPVPAPGPAHVPAPAPAPGPTHVPAPAPAPAHAPAPAPVPGPAHAPAPVPAPGPAHAPAHAPVPTPGPAHAPAPALTHSSSRTTKPPVKSASAPKPGPISPTQTPPTASQALPSTTQAPPSAPQGHHSRRRPGRPGRASGVGRISRAPSVTPCPLAPSDDCMEETPVVSLEKEHEGTQETESLSANQEAGISCSSKELQTSIYESPSGLSESWPAPSERKTIVLEKQDGDSPGKGQLGGKTHPRSITHIPLALMTLNDPGDRLRLARAKKLRELLKKAMRKDKLKEKQQRPRVGSKEPKTVKDHTKMTMRELIYYLPPSNPMTSYTEDEQRVTEMVLPSSPTEKPLVSQPVCPEPVEAAEEDEEMVGSRLEEDESLLAPRVKVAEDGSLIIDEESLTVEVLRVKGPNPAEERDPIFERGSTTTYSSFRKGTYTKPWSIRETDMFFLAISMVGTDFSMISQLFPHRARIEIKNKFKKEERTNSWRIDKAFKERRCLDLEFFSDLLGKILKDEDNKRKKKKNSAKLAKAAHAPQGKPAARKRKARSSCSEDESSGSDVMEGEKENEDVCNDGGLTGAPIRPRRKTARASPKKSGWTNKPAEEDESEYSTSEERSPVDRSQEPESAGEKPESCGVRPAQRLLPDVDRRWGSRGAAVSRKTPDPGGPAGGERLADGPSEEEERRYTSDVISCGLEDSEEEEEPNLAAIQENIFNKPTRSGRIPKLSQHVIRAAASEEDEEEPSSCPPPGGSHTRALLGSGRRGQMKAGPSLTRGLPRWGKSRLLTLLASTEEEEEEEEEQVPAGAEDENQVFVPMGLRTVAPVSTEVEETMEELDISVNVPEVLGISHNGVCPESLCKNALSPTGSVPCEHQLDLLVDVIEFLTPDHMEVSEESYAEAARTLLTIGHAAHVTPTAEAVMGHAAHVTPTAEAVMGRAAHVTPTAEALSTGDVIFVEDPRLSQQVVQQEVVLETTDHSEPRPETSREDTFDPCVSIVLDCSGGADPVGNVCEGTASTPEPTSQQDSNFMEEPVVSQETDDLLGDSQSGASNTTVLQRVHLLRPKPNLSTIPRRTQVQQEETPPDPGPAAQNLLTVAPSQGATEARMVKTSRDPGEAGSTPTLTGPAGAWERVSAPDRTARVKGEGDRPGLPPDTPPEGGASAGVVEVEQQSVEVEKTMEVEKNQQPQQPHGVHEPQTGSHGSESSVQPSQALRRFRGPKPKPNVVGFSRNRTPRTQTHQSPAVPTEAQAAVISTNTFTDAQSTGGGGHVTLEPDMSLNAKRESELPLDSVMVRRPNLHVQISPIISEGRKGSNPEALVRSFVEPYGSTSRVMSAHLPLEPVPASEEPIFILSLTEVPPTVVREEEHGTEPLPFLETSELVAETLSTGGPSPAGEPPSPLVFPEVLVPVSEDQERDVGDREQSRACDRIGVEKNPAMGWSVAQRVEPSISSAAEGSSEETDCPAKQCKRPESTRRAKLQIRPNPVQRKSHHSLPAKRRPTPPPSEKSSDTPTSSQETTPTAETVPVTRTKAPPTPLPSFPSQPFTMDMTTPESASQPSSQSIVGQLDLPQVKKTEAAGIEEAEANGSGAESQPVRQSTPAAATGTLTRPGRRPRGFLSFMSSAGTLGSSPSKRTSQRPVAHTARANQRRAAPGTLTSVGRAAPASQFCRVTPSPASSRPPAPATPQQCETSGTNPPAEEEPTSVSAYFFNDIFTMVDELEMMESKD